MQKELMKERMDADLDVLGMTVSQRIRPQEIRRQTQDRRGRREIKVVIAKMSLLAEPFGLSSGI